MAKLVELKNAKQDANDKQRTIYVNPAHVVSVDTIIGGVMITMSVGKPFLLQQVAIHEVLGAINQGML
jgi:hypothetical protein